MCGICGKIYLDTGKKVDGNLIEKMCSVLSHRGPDDAGVYLKDNIGLGHRRLSVLDVSPAGHQPMTNEDGTIWIVCNGEIYNFIELRRDLEKKGHVFSSNSDTEVIIHLYEEKGVECLQDMQGMFAFALWDDKEKSLFLARDRLGKKPLVYSFNKGVLLFASEIKSLLFDPDLPRDIDQKAILSYLTYGYISSPLTIFSSIKKLLPAHYMVFKDGALTIKRYWNLSYQKKLVYGSLLEYQDHFLELFSDAIKMRLRSDVPFGAFLSGGIDSGMVVALMSRFLDQPVKTFSIGFEETDYNELPFAQMVADKYSTDHHEFVVKPDVVDVLPKLMWAYNEPYADPSAVPTYHLSKVTRQHVAVALSGDGGDECFVGYNRYLHSQASYRYSKCLTLLNKKVISKIVDLLPNGETDRNFFKRSKSFLKHLCLCPEKQYLRWIAYFDDSLRKEICSASFNSSVAGLDPSAYIEDLYHASDAESFMDRTLNVDVMSYLPEDLMVKTDIASMACSLEVRSPFMDHRVMEFAASLPVDMKIYKGNLKYFLKRAAEDLLPSDIINRKKQGFGLPVANWLRQDLKEMTYDLLLDKSAEERGYLNGEKVKKLLSDHMSGQSDHCHRIWNLLCLELWFRAYLDNMNRFDEVCCGF